MLPGRYPIDWCELDRCEVVDDMSGAVCTRQREHEGTVHSDLSQPGIQITWSTDSALLYVVDGGT